MPTQRTLVVDDCRVTLSLLKHMVTKLGVRTDAAGDGEEALSLLAERDYPLVFLDVVLPNIDGFEVCRRLREMSAQSRVRKESRTRVYLLTALGEAYSPEKATEVGADGVFFKPIVPSHIIDVVREVFGLER